MYHLLVIFGFEKTIEHFLVIFGGLRCENWKKNIVNHTIHVVGQRFICIDPVD
jgi:hypothetical protein